MQLPISNLRLIGGFSATEGNSNLAGLKPDWPVLTFNISLTFLLLPHRSSLLSATIDATLHRSFGTGLLFTGKIKPGCSILFQSGCKSVFIWVSCLIFLIFSDNKLPDFSIGFSHVAKKCEGYFILFTVSYLVYRQIWLNYLMDDPHFSYLRKPERWNLASPETDSSAGLLKVRVTSSLTCPSRSKLG
jgi:hypothetical protein